MAHNLELLIATRNPGKVREVSSLISLVPRLHNRLRLRSLADFPAVPEAPESHATFRENAVEKARFYAAHTHLVALADDSGLEVASLKGDPGVHSARYGGTHLTDAERVQLLLREMKAARVNDRRARFVCVIAIADPVSDRELEAFGCCAGHIASAPRGEQGFGYDPVFIPSGYLQTFAELAPNLKDRLSHRGQAMTLASQLLVEFFGQTSVP